MGNFWDLCYALCKVYLLIGFLQFLYFMVRATISIITRRDV